jgi:threonine/homoserine/homoserine lactone efflux protein
MHPFVAFFSILGALALGAISPGPSFLFVTRTAVAVSRRASLAAAAGMGLGAALICLLALLGVRAVLAQAEELYIVFKVLGGAYLCFLAWRLWRGASNAAPEIAAAGHIPGWMYPAIPITQLFVEGSWYAFVAIAMSSPGPRRIYSRARGSIDRVAGCVLGALGLRLIFEGAKEAA